MATALQMTVAEAYPPLYIIGIFPSLVSDSRPPVAGASIASRFGEITPEFAAAFGARVDVGLLLAARNARARELATAARRARGVAGKTVRR